LNFRSVNAKKVRDPATETGVGRDYSHWNQLAEGGASMRRIGNVALAGIAVVGVTMSSAAAAKGGLAPLGVTATVLGCQSFANPSPPASVNGDRRDNSGAGRARVCSAATSSRVSTDDAGIRLFRQAENGSSADRVVTITY
jgi:hypothetical protein